MLFLAHLDVSLPESLAPELFEDFQLREQKYARDLQGAGIITGLWQEVGQASSYCLIEVSDTDQLQEVLSGFPLYRYFDVQITPLTQHPNAV
ncbi:muconolactone Delta-isomerase [Corynebacterium alimapuense]|uniref:Muconolactone Delta-isomerase n=1 Tax=Corynebacterium alimapuense TaxID=1576874 RepID=A0A3M8K6C8_9CORY|nr:muconolactone Delta-isomerase family protein [Corynebacterium alimapuense]RNE48419.1 muconolactone delta-isomerase [Corynebacterium alimapuense]